ncbi:hypothetical protein GCK72_002085 [Caenorhabditis remanei]|uniref:Uncharacterized protein n=1 Tax=Caenorhabditis remanei TaxID=31234 RepID=A0A6A5HVH8_CAERE|nr:hypothetical protein GCK72_002085 [Caenorhabditis remanei]KAF1770267.1 hypothetical protein GCK72_002085 [Caenorhabditis remanei]
MAPRTRSSAKNLLEATSCSNSEKDIKNKTGRNSIVDHDSSKNCRSKRLRTQLHETVEGDIQPVDGTSLNKKLVDSQTTDDEIVLSDSDDISSSSAEDSDDDYEKEISKKCSTKSEDSDCSTDREQDDERRVKRIQQKIDREEKKKRLVKYEKKHLDGVISDDDEIECAFESSNIPKQRKRRLYRRRMLRETGVTKRRRIKRLDMDITNDYTCDTFVEFGLTLEELTTDIDCNDLQINHKAARKMFKEEGSDDDGFSDNDNSEEDDADMVSGNLLAFQKRNCKERVSQIIQLSVAPFSEKLACYNSLKAVHGSSRSSIQNYHPSFLIKQDIKLPEELLWEQPLTHLLYLPTKFDTHKKCNDFLDKAYETKKKETESKLLEGIRSIINKKAAENQLKLEYNPIRIEEANEIQILNQDPNNFYATDKPCFEDQGYILEDDYPDCSMDGF